MGFIPAKIPFIIKKAFPDYVWDRKKMDKVLYLTFDDGPTPEITDWTIKTLAQFNAKATFFCVGNNIKQHPNIFHRVLDNGHTIGNHSNTHLKGWRTKNEDYISDVESCQRIIETEYENYNFNGPKLFRPPYGQLKLNQGKILKKLGYAIIMWDILSFDWQNNTNPKTCFNNVKDNSKSGSIIVFHDSVKASRNLMFALPKVLEYYSEKGYSFKALNV